MELHLSRVSITEMVMAALISAFVISSVNSAVLIKTSSRPTSVLDIAATPIRIILNDLARSDVSVILILDSRSSSDYFVWEFMSSEAVQGLGVFEVTIEEMENSNITEATMVDILSTATQLRKTSRAVVAVVVSMDVSFLMSFSKWSLETRLLASDTKLISVSRLDRVEIDLLLRSYWTFSMMDAMILNYEGKDENFSFNIYSHLPYSLEGKDVIFKLASWRGEKLSLSTSFPLFPTKFINFYGHAMPVTALPFPPFWDERESLEDTSKVIYSGTDYYLLEAIADAHNFSIFVVPTANWGEVLDKVETRESFIASIFHAVLPERLKRFDYSYIYEYSSVDFSFSKPEVKPQWQSLIYPLSDKVWMSSGAFFLIMAGLVIMFGRSAQGIAENLEFNSTAALLELTGTLVTQNLSKSLPQNQSRRVLIGSWMIFSLILGTAYRGNLVAYLTLPKYPPRPENLKELVKIADRITMPPYGKDFKAFFSQSDSADFIKLASLMHFVPNIVEGQKQAIAKRQGHLDTRRYQEHYIAQKFTRIDGTTELYVGKDGVLAGKSAWPIPHDAPYANIINRGLMAVLEAGLYEHWSRQLIEETKRETRLRLRKQKEDAEKQGTANLVTMKTTSAIMALTLIHLQGPLMLLAVGLILASTTFVLEFSFPSLFQ